MNLKAMAGRRILFLALADWAGASRLLGEFGRLGCECAVISPPDFTVTMTRFATVLFRLPSPRSQGLPKLRLMTSRFRLEEANRKWHPDLIVPLDDYAAWLLRGLPPIDQ